MEPDLLMKHQKWANRMTITTLGILTWASIPAFLFVGSVSLRTRILCVALSFVGMTLIASTSRWQRTKSYTRYVAPVLANAIALLFMFFLGEQNTSVPFLFFALMGFSMIYLDPAVVLINAVCTVGAVISYDLIRPEIMRVSYTQVTVAYMMAIYVIAVPALYAAAKRARKLLADLQERELGQLKLIDSLTRVLDEAAGASTRVKESSGVLFDRASELQASAEEAAAGMEEMARMVDVQAGEVTRVTQNVSEIHSLSQGIVRRSEALSTAFQQTSQAAEQGVTLARNTLSKMASMGSTMEQLTLAAQNLKDRSLRINDILTFLEGIGAQTNLLSLNATIEAARAGDAGKGFSVVAEEIRKLAEQSNHGAKEIGQIVSMTVEDVDRVFETAQTSAAAVTGGVQDVGHVSEDFRRILDSIQQGTMQIREVYSAMEELVAQNNSIMDAAASLASLSQETAAGTEEISAAVQNQASDIQSVADQARNLGETSHALESMVHEYGNVKK